MVCFPPLPAELIREIVEEAAAHRPTALALLLVCKSFCTWATPILYRVVRATSQDELRLLHLSCLAHKLGQVKDLALHVQPRLRGIVNDILEACTGVQRLLVIIGNDPPLHSSMKPWMVNVVNYTSSSINWQNSNFLAAVTHLYIEYGFRLSTNVYSRLEVLTHIGFSGGVWEDLFDDHYLHHIKQALENPNLEVVLVCSPVRIHQGSTPTENFIGQAWIELAKTQDPRLFARPGIKWDTHVEIFESGGSIWDDIDKYQHWRDLVKIRDI